MGDIEIRVIKRANRDEVVALYKGAGWWKQEYSDDISFIDGIVAHSFCFVGAFHEDRLIGMGRSISDGVSDAYIQDVTVMRGFRGRGTGKRIINELVRHAWSRGIDWIAVIAEPDTVAFYEKLGFAVMEKHTPMRRRGNE